ncbi:MAG: nickel pincer cofactor biosynthesis protein LarC [Desulfuromonadaceae bacterium]|nr:nickel pincer cofactor biosynthesis protein LarC [Desulfuromonadaceae bacterium]
MILCLDPFAGISGDMFLGLLVDLGVDVAAFEAQLACLPLPAYQLEWQREKRRGIAGTRCLVHAEEQTADRTWRAIDTLLAESSLAMPVRDLARRIFRRLAVAEARVHGTTPEEVHFHEVGALDSIIDIVGAAIGLTTLAPAQIVCAPLPLTRGMVTTRHGNYPLPAPATLELLSGVPLQFVAGNQELVTPTGAAIVAEVATFGSFPPCVPVRVGYGVGSRDPEERPNVLRGFLAQHGGIAGLETDQVAVIETHLDDANPEWLGDLMERLFDAGALDVAYAPLQMKKNRPGVRITVIASLKQRELLARQLLHHSSAIGVRCYETTRYKLRRAAATLTTELGEVQVKLLFDGDALVRVTPEYDSCREVARRHQRPLADVYRLAEIASAAHDWKA